MRIDKDHVFTEVRRAVGDALGFNHEKVNLEDYLADDLGADSIDLREIELILQRTFDPQGINNIDFEVVQARLRLGNKIRVSDVAEGVWEALSP